jgi:hypothetical protein
MAHEHLDAELVLERADLLRHAGLRSVERLGGLGDVEVAAGDLGQIAELLQLHITDRAYNVNTIVFAGIREPSTMRGPCTSTTRSTSGW